MRAGRHRGQIGCQPIERQGFGERVAHVIEEDQPGQPVEPRLDEPGDQTPRPCQITPAQHAREPLRENLRAIKPLGPSPLAGTPGGQRLRIAVRLHFAAVAPHHEVARRVGPFDRGTLADRQVLSRARVSPPGALWYQLGSHFAAAPGVKAGVEGPRHPCRARAGSSRTPSRRHSARSVMAAPVVPHPNCVACGRIEARPARGRCRHVAALFRRWRFRHGLPRGRVPNRVPVEGKIRAGEASRGTEEKKTYGVNPRTYVGC